MKENFEGKIKLSIVIPVYNVEDTIERAVESIFLNDFKNIEVLLIDDGSTDNSGSWDCLFWIEERENWRRCNCVNQQ